MDAGILYLTTDAEDFLSDSGFMRHSIRQRMQQYLHQTADAGDATTRQRMQQYLNQTAGAGDTLSESRCRSLSIRQRMQEYLNQTAGA